jgi:hypothetical protein
MVAVRMAVPRSALPLYYRKLPPLSKVKAMSALRVCLLLLIGLVAGAAQADPAATIDGAPCPEAPCRDHIAKADLALPEGGRGVLTFGPGPYVYNGSINLFAGETLVFRFTPTADGPGVPQFVEAIDRPPPHHLLTDDPAARPTLDPKTGETFTTLGRGSPVIDAGTARDHLAAYPPNTMIVSLHQVPGHFDMILTVEHNLAMPLKYDARMARELPAGLQPRAPTSTCPVSPLVLGFESWPYAIGDVALANFRFEDKGTLRCE